MRGAPATAPPRFASGRNVGYSSRLLGFGRFVSAVRLMVESHLKQLNLSKVDAYSWDLLATIATRQSGHKMIGGREGGDMAI